jgi:hypothetical protein
MTGKWIITKDHLYEQAVKEGHYMSQFDRNEKGTCSVDWVNPAMPSMHEFRMLDDDGNVYYEGICTDNESENAFRPLDEFGEPNAGCTSIQYKMNGSWETL